MVSHGIVFNLSEYTNAKIGCTLQMESSGGTLYDRFMTAFYKTVPHHSKPDAQKLANHEWNQLKLNKKVDPRKEEERITKLNVAASRLRAKNQLSLLHMFQAKPSTKSDVLEQSVAKSIVELGDPVASTVAIPSS